MPARTTSLVFKRKELVARLNPTCQRAFKAAADTAKLRGNPYVELAHFIEQLVLSDRADVQAILLEAEIDPARLAAEMTRAIDRLPYGATSIEEFSDHIFHAIQEGWNYGSLQFGDETVRSAYILLAALKVPVLDALLGKISGEFDKIDADAIGARLTDVLAGSIEGARAEPETPAEAKPRRGPGGDSALAKYATDLTARARDDKIDPVVGRDPEIRQIIDVLMRRRQNNPILTGEAGVGKTAVVEGFALRLAQGDVPPMLQGVSLRMLDVGLMQAGASVKGEFEKRLRAVIEEVQASETPIILFIDEAHTLIGAGGAAGTGDAANLLKPALARGELRTIAATTWSEYKQYIEKDPALTRRFQVVKVEEPDEAAAVQMLRGVAATLERHHQRADPRRRHRGGGRALPPLHPGPPAPRQGGEPARHRLRPRRGVAARHPGRGRGPAPAQGDARGRERHHRPRGRHRHRRRGPAGEARGGAWTRTPPASKRPKRAGRPSGRWSRRSSSSAPGCAARACRSTRRPRPSRRWPRPAKPRRPSRARDRRRRPTARPTSPSSAGSRPSSRRRRARRR